MIDSLIRIVEWRRPLVSIIENSYRLEDGTIILGDMRCFRPGLVGLKCKACGETVEKNEEYWMQKDKTFWKGNLGDVFDEGYCKSCMAENFEVLSKRPTVLYPTAH